MKYRRRDIVWDDLWTRVHHSIKSRSVIFLLAHGPYSWVISLEYDLLQVRWKEIKTI